MSSICHPYVTCMHSYVTSMSHVCTRMSLVCTRMSSVCHSSMVLLWTLSQGSIEQDHLPTKVKVSVFGVFNTNINFSTESEKNPTIYDFLFNIAIYSPKNVNKYLLSEIKNYYRSCFFLISVVSQIRAHFSSSSKIVDYCQIIQEFFWC